jgi:hypothetical protein
MISSSIGLMNRHFCWQMCLLLLTAFTPGNTHAQSGVHGVAARIDHESVGDMRGGSIMLGTGSSHFRFGIEYLRSRFEATRVVCAGLIPMEWVCDPEPALESARLLSIVAEYGFDVVNRQSISIELLTAASAGNVSSSTSGLTYGRRLQANKNFVGAHLGLVTSWYPWWRHRAGLQITASVGGLQPLTINPSVDGYDPFEESTTMVRGSVGFVIRR